MFFIVLRPPTRATSTSTLLTDTTLLRADDDQLLEHDAPRPTCLRAGHRRSGYRAAPGGWSRCLYCPGVARLADQLPLAVVGERLCTDLTDEIGRAHD